MPAHVTLSVPPRAIDDGLAETLVLAVTVKLLLTASCAWVLPE
jgi:hypothetical protein